MTLKEVILKRKCPGFSYCMKMFLIHEMVADLKTMKEYRDDEKIVERLIYYVEYNAWKSVNIHRQMRVF